MNTYIIESQGFIKIGRAADMEKRLNHYRTHNPKFELLKILKEDLENELHTLLADKRYRNEWFLLDEEDLKYLLSDEILKVCRDLKQKKQEDYYNSNKGISELERKTRKKQSPEEYKLEVLNKIKEAELKKKSEKPPVFDPCIRFGVVETSSDN